MKKLKMQTPNITEQNMEQIAKLFPNVMTESQDEKGNTKKAIDFDLLKQSLSSVLVEDADERYRLDWPGKKAALLKANTPITKTLRPCREDSVNFDSTENVYIEGDNFEVLKILQESYLGKIKMIYIDPPYNTGKDFIYKDNYTAKKADYEKELGTTDEDDNKLFRNTDTNGRFHSDWLSMMYERLVVARDLLKEDGVIFISIDDNEVHNLREICDEVFGEENLKNSIVVRRGIKNVQAQFEDISALSSGHEYILVYSKNAILRFQKLIYSHDVPKPGKWDTFWRGTDRETMRYELFGNTPKNGQWRWEENRTRKAIENYKFYLENYAGSMSLDEWYLDNLTANSIKLNFVRKSKESTVQYYVSPSEGKLLSDNWMDILLSGNETKFFDTEKNKILLQRIITWITLKSNNEIILDFFSGSATTAHAVMQLNAKDNGNRKFIMVQLPEATDEKSEAYKAGYKTIAEIGKERIRRAGKAIINDELSMVNEKNNSSSTIHNSQLDTGFRVYKTDSSNMKEVYYHPEQLSQNDLFSLESNLKAGRTPDDLLTQVILDLGLELNLPIEQKTMHGNNVFIVQTNALVACFDEHINIKIIDEIAALKPFKVVFKDASFAASKDRINLEERFKRLSPETLIAVL